MLTISQKPPTADRHFATPPPPSESTVGGAPSPLAKL